MGTTRMLPCPSYYRVLGLSLEVLIPSSREAGLRLIMERVRGGGILAPNLQRTGRGSLNDRGSLTRWMSGGCRRLTSLDAPTHRHWPPRAAGCL